MKFKHVAPRRKEIKEETPSQKVYLLYCLPVKKLPRWLFSEDSKKIHSKKLQLAQSYEVIVNKTVFKKAISCKTLFQILIYQRSVEFSVFTILQLK